MVVQPVGAEAAYPVSLALAKMNSRVTHNFEDDLFNLWIASSFLAIRRWCQRPILRQQWQAVDDSLSGCLEISGLGPFGVTGVQKTAGANAAVTLQTSEYSIGYNAGSMIIDLAEKPVTGDVITVNFVVGYDPVPEDIIACALFLIEDKNQNRSSQIMGSPLIPNQTFESLLRPHGLLLA
jgi:hypothetical protein